MEYNSLERRINKVCNTDTRQQDRPHTTLYMEIVHHFKRSYNPLVVAFLIIPQDHGHVGSRHGQVVSLVDFGSAGSRFESASSQSTLFFLRVVHDWVNKSLAMSSHVCVTGHIRNPVPLIEKSRALCPSGRFHPRFIKVIIITGLNKLYE